MFPNLFKLSEKINSVFIVIFAAIFVLLVCFTAILIYFILRSKGSKKPVLKRIPSNIKLEIIWTIFPLILVAGMFFFGWKGYKTRRLKPPKNAIHVNLTANMRYWSFTYTNGKQTDTLVIPQGEAVSISFQTTDVIRGFYIPSLRVGKNIEPGRDRSVWFIANKTGTYDIFCAKYPGLDHSHRIGSVKVLSQKDYNRWYENAEKGNSKVTVKGATETKGRIKSREINTAQLGRSIVERMGCFACHSTDGSKIVGPSYFNLYGKKQTVLTYGKERLIKVDAAYIRKSILDPDADIVQGYPEGIMQSYKGRLTDEQINDIVDYLKTLKK